MEHLLYRPWVDWSARQIQDPIWRLRYLRALTPEPVVRKRFNPLKIIGLAVICSILPGSAPWSHRVAAAPAPKPAPIVYRVAATAPDAPPPVWLVEKSNEFEAYSNGLRIENRYETENRRRSFLAFPLDDRPGEPRTEPAGIVFHTTESLQAPFEPSKNTVLKRVGESLLEYVARRRAYHFLIDRFGRVWRIVRESDAANHAGHSVWADGSWIYVNLNDSFLGISFEAQTAAAVTAVEINPAQIRAAAMLTEMLRSRYRIAAADCVTHAQVSVNPTNFQIGYHTDWASSFPFERLGLPDNYARTLPSIALFGFEYDSAFVDRAGPRLADAAGRSLTADGRSLRARYRRLAAAMKTANTEVE